SIRVLQAIKPKTHWLHTSAGHSIPTKIAICLPRISAVMGRQILVLVRSGVIFLHFRRDGFSQRKNFCCLPTGRAQRNGEKAGGRLVVRPSAAAPTGTLIPEIWATTYLATIMATSAEAATTGEIQTFVGKPLNRLISALSSPCSMDRLTWWPTGLRRQPTACC